MPPRPKPGRTRHRTSAFRADLQGAVLHPDDRTAAQGRLCGFRRRRTGDGRFDVPVGVHLHTSVGHDRNVGGGAADVHRNQRVLPVQPGVGERALEAATRTGTPGLDRRGLGHPRRIAVVAVVQRSCQVMVLADVFRAVQEVLHARMQVELSSIKPARTPAVIRIADQFVRQQERHGAEKMARVAVEQQILDAGFGRLAARSAITRRWAPRASRSFTTRVSTWSSTVPSGLTSMPAGAMGTIDAHRPSPASFR